MKSTKYLPALVAGFAAAVLTTIPGLKTFGCCLIVPFGSIFALYLQRVGNKDFAYITASKAIKYGLLTGLYTAIFATFFDVIITYVTKSNELVAAIPDAEKMLSNFLAGPLAQQGMQIFKQMATDITTKGFSGLYTFYMFTSSAISYSIFGILGGLLGMNLINRRNKF